MQRVDKFLEILNQGCIDTVYQPIVSLKDGSIFGYEALSRITIPSCEINIGDLFSIASQENKIWELEMLCRRKALENACTKPIHSKLFINVDANIMNDPQLKIGFTSKKLLEYGMNPQDIIFEVTEKSAVQAMDDFTAAIKHYRSQKYKIAVDDFGSGYSGLNRVCTFSPEFLKIDMELVHDIDKDSLKKSAVSATINFCKESNIQVIAEGIETEEELKTLIRLGVDYGQGYYLARPSKGFSRIPYDVKIQIKATQNETELKFVSSLFGKIHAISKPSITVRKAEPSLKIYEAMREDADLREVFVVDDKNHVCGVITRNNLFQRYSGEFGYNLSRRLSVGKIMQNEYLAVNDYLSIEEVASLAMQRDTTEVYDGIAIQSDGKYIGSVSVKDLLLTAIQVQVKRATEASPLTGLPGNTVIQQTINDTFLKENPWAIIYLDLDNFKAYNDAYGFSNGDLMLKTLSDCMRKCCSENDFMGHIGGDDFVIISYHHQIQCLCENIFNKFTQSIKSLYSAKDWEQGYIVSKNRNGFTQNFPIATLSISVVTNHDLQPISLEDLSFMIANAKKQSKQKHGNSIVII